MAIKWIGSPNKDKGREGYRPEAIVIHIIKTRIDVNIRELAPTTRHRSSAQPNMERN